MSITKGERTELRGVVRQQFRVLQDEVQQRASELLAEARREVEGRYADIDTARADVDAQALAIVEKAQRDIVDLLGRHPETKPRPGAGRIGWPGVSWQPDARFDLQGQASTEIVARASAARLQLKRQEADLLRNLAVDALETEEARAFLGTIPTAAELVPAVRLAELEAQFEDGR